MFVELKLSEAMWDLIGQLIRAHRQINSKTTHTVERKPAILEFYQLFKGFKIFLQSSDNFSYIGNFVGYILKYSRTELVHGFALWKANCMKKFQMPKLTTANLLVYAAWHPPQAVDAHWKTWNIWKYHLSMGILWQNRIYTMVLPYIYGFNRRFSVGIPSQSTF